MNLSASTYEKQIHAIADFQISMWVVHTQAIKQGLYRISLNNSHRFCHFK